MVDSCWQPFDPHLTDEGHWLCVAAFPRVCLFEDQEGETWSIDKLIVPPAWPLSIIAWLDDRL